MASTPSPAPQHKYKGKQVPDDYVDTTFSVIMTDPVTLPCKHRFNKLQITRWVASKPSCPLCRGTDIKLADDTTTKQAVSKWLIQNGFESVAFGHPEGIPLE